MTKGIPLLAFVLVLGPPLAGCEALSDSDRALHPQSFEPSPEVPPADAGQPDDADVSPEGDASAEAAPAASYEAMCRHYCQTLEETFFYYCLGTGADSVECRGKIPDHAARCHQDRCVPQLVPASLCPRQCEALASYYGPVCTGREIGKDPLCPSSPADHDRACRAGCE